jgi:Fur family peroxide stress response transcriptional regulator
MQAQNESNSLDFFTQKCRQHHLKITPQRTAIYKELKKSKDHPSADTIYQIIRKGFPNISFDTINRTLLIFSRIGIVDVVEGLGAPRRFDPNKNKHHHFLCVKCGQIDDFMNDLYDQIEIPKHLQQRYTILGQKVVLHGICDKCREEI